MVDHVGNPVRLSTNADDTESNAFYRRLGFRLTGRKMASNGVLMNSWERA